MSNFFQTGIYPHKLEVKLLKKSVVSPVSTHFSNLSDNPIVLQ